MGVRELVHQAINWSEVEERLGKYPAIGRAFPTRLLQRGCDTAPYYCHPMAWRLGVWFNEDHFATLDRLLGVAETVPRWKQEQQQLAPDLDFGGFWSLMWMVQVCDFLLKNAESVEFRGNRGGPDLACIVNGERLYVECYSVRQSRSPIEFIKEVLSVHAEDVRIDTRYMVPMNLQHPADAIEHVLTSATNSAVLAAARARAADEYPVEVARYPADAQREAVLIRANVESDTGGYMPSTEFPNAVGEPRFAMKRLAQAAIEAKAKKGQLRDLKPNMLATSLLLGGEAQIGTHMRPGFKPDPSLAGGIEALAVAWVGINAELTKPDLRLWALERSPHPAERLCGSNASAS